MVNVGSGQKVSIAEPARIIAGIVDYRGEFVFDRSKPDGTPRKTGHQPAGWIGLEDPDQTCSIENAYHWFVEHHAEFRK